MKSEKIRTIILSVFFISLAFLAVLIPLRRETEPSSPDERIRQKLSSLERSVIDILSVYGINHDHIDISLDLVKDLREISAPAPRGIPMEEIIAKIQALDSHESYTLADSYANYQLTDRTRHNDRAIIIFESTEPDRENIKVILTQGDFYAPHTADLKFVITNLKRLSPKIRLQYLTFEHGDFTYGLSPWDHQAEEYYSILHGYEKTVMTALPMESKIDRNTLPTPYTIALDDTRESINHKVEALLREFPNTRAIASQGGSRALANTRCRKNIFSVLAEKKQPFYDRRSPDILTAKYSTFRREARNTGLEYHTGTAVFPTGDTAELEENLRSTARQALHRGRLTLFAEATPEFITALENMVPFFKERGIALVPLETIDQPEPYGKHSPLLLKHWVGIVFSLGGAGVAIYLILRKKRLVRRKRKK
ncbi:MAG: divergent polysaccharide deacetylase family protein [Fibrobacterota bacterium]